MWGIERKTSPKLCQKGQNKARLRYQRLCKPAARLPCQPRGPTQSAHPNAEVWRRDSQTMQPQPRAAPYPKAAVGRGMAMRNSRTYVYNENCETLHLCQQMNGKCVLPRNRGQSSCTQGSLDIDTVWQQTDTLLDRRMGVGLHANLRIWVNEWVAGIRHPSRICMLHPTRVSVSCYTCPGNHVCAPFPQLAACPQPRGPPFVAQIVWQAVRHAVQHEHPEFPLLEL